MKGVSLSTKRTPTQAVQQMLAHLQGLTSPADTGQVSSKATTSPVEDSAERIRLPVMEMAKKMSGSPFHESFRSDPDKNFEKVFPMKNAINKMGAFPFFLLGCLMLFVLTLVGQGLNTLFTNHALEIQQKANQTALQAAHIELQKAKIQAEIEAVKNGTLANNQVVLAEEKRLLAFSCQTETLRDEGFAKVEVQEIASSGDFAVHSGCALVRFSGPIVLKQVSGDGMVYIEDASSATGYLGCSLGSVGKTQTSCESFIARRYGEILRVVVPQDRTIKFSTKKGV